MPKTLHTYHYRLSDFIEAKPEKRIAAAKAEGEARAYRKFAEWQRR